MSGAKSMFDPNDARARIVELENHLEAELAKKRRLEDIRAGIVINGVKRADQGSQREVFIFILSAVALVLGVSVGIVWTVLKIF